MASQDDTQTGPKKGKAKVGDDASVENIVPDIEIPWEKSKAEKAVDDLTDAASEMGDTVSDAASEMGDSVSDVASEMSEKVEDAAQELIDELTNLGQKFVEVIEVAWNSEQRKKIEEDLKAGLVTAAHTLEDGFKKVTTTKEAQTAVNAAEDVAGRLRRSKIAVDLSDILTQGLKAVSEQMDKIAAEIKKGSEAVEKTASSAQDIPIDTPLDIKIDLGTKK